MTRQEFFELLAPYAVRARQEGSSLFPSVRLAQNLLETGGTVNTWNNLGGIKVGSGKLTPYWHGRTVNRKTWEVYNGKRTEESADFRAYDSIYDFFRDQDLLLQIPRYAGVRSARTPEEQARQLQACGYATDPDYGSKLISIMNAYGLNRYDTAVLPEKASYSLVPIIVDSHPSVPGFAIDGMTWAPARVVGILLGGSVGWNGKAVTINGQVQETRILDGSGFVPLREMAQLTGARVYWDAAARLARVTR